ncbi:uncharacterized protein VTP21DRAFT_10858 [Calcarisporiella thermophila]|uniref:uncharacterized protein n=1 Tax=Calcarisporiella thermophila TaxID=911321 RepID=UPI0037446C7E
MGRKQHAGPKNPPLASTADKHSLYHESVQAPRRECQTLANIYRHLSQQHPIIPPRILREDFCGTAILCHEWVHRDVNREAIGIDLDKEVLEYGRRRLEDSVEGERVRLVHEDVRKVKGLKADILCALNYGICYLHKRRELVSYLRNCKEDLNENGVFICDLFGGLTAHTGQYGRKHRGSNFEFCNALFIQYFFEQTPVDTVSSLAKCRLHFRFEDGKLAHYCSSWMKNAFSYEFRLYTIREVREAMEEAGFTQTHIWISRAKSKRSHANRTEEDEIDDEESADEDDEDEDEDEDEEDEDEEDADDEYQKVEGDHYPALKSWNAYLVGKVE